MALKEMLNSKKFYYVCLAWITYVVSIALGQTQFEAIAAASFFLAGGGFQAVTDHGKYHGKEKAKIEAEIVPNSEMEP